MPKKTQRRHTASRSSSRSSRTRGRRTTSRPKARRSARMAPARRNASGRFVKRRRVRARPGVRSRPRRMRAAPRRAAARPRRVRRYQRLAKLGIVREASERSVAAPALVKRRWFRIDGPVDPSLPEGYALPR